MPVAVTPPKPEPHDLQCDIGETTCSGECPVLPEWKLTLDGMGDFDDLGGLAALDKIAMDTCKAKLKACQLCIDRGKKAGVIR